MRSTKSICESLQSPIPLEFDLNETEVGKLWVGRLTLRADRLHFRRDTLHERKPFPLHKTLGNRFAVTLLQLRLVIKKFKL